MAKRTYELPDGRWEALSGKSRRYVNLDTGETISRRAFLDRRADVLGFDSYKEYTDLTRDSKYTRFLDMAENNGEERSTLRQLDSIASREYAAYLSEKNAGHSRRYLNRAHGPLARFAEAIGIRESDADYDFGDTPGAAGGTSAYNPYG